MRILLITSEAWNDKIHGNNVLTNWFDGFDAEFAQIYCSPGEPFNKCCKKYFQLTDSMMIKSLFGKSPAGVVKYYEDFPCNSDNATDNKLEPENKSLYLRLKSITTETLRTVREMIWYFGKYNLKSLKSFINDYDPDIIFCPRFGSIKTLRLERTVYSIANKPIVAFTGDDEYTLNQFRLSPVYWVKRFITRRMFRKVTPMYSLYYSHSEEQAENYSKIFKVPTAVLLKCGEFSADKVHTKVNSPIKIVYAGKLYCNRWKNLTEIGRALERVNCNDVKMVLEIYTKDKVSKKQFVQLNDGKNIFLRPPVSPEKLKEVYDNADIALHVESFDLKNKLLTKLSFSTKIIDCLASGCAVMAMCWEKHNGFLYLKKQDAAFTISSKTQVYEVLKNISENPELITKYAQKATICGMNNHQKEIVQKKLFDDFNNIIKEKSNECIADKCSVQ